MPENPHVPRPEDAPAPPRGVDQQFIEGGAGEPSPDHPAKPQPAPRRTDADDWWYQLSDREQQDYIDMYIEGWGGDEGD